MYSIVVEVVYCAGNNASLLRLLLMNTATSTALHCADLSHCTLQKLRSRRCRQSSRFFSIRPLLCMCVSVHSVWSYKKWRRKVILLSIHYYVVLKCRSLEY